MVTLGDAFNVRPLAIFSKQTRIDEGTISVQGCILKSDASARALEIYGR